MIAVQQLGPVVAGQRSDDPALSVDRLTKRFGPRTAYSELSFQVAHGEVFGFLGPNGAGKTTTVRTLGTLIAPTSGSATVAGIPLSPENGAEIRQHISIMPEAPGLYLRLTVTENLEYFARLYGLRDPATRINEAIDAVNLGDRARDLCGGLSKGLRQRVGLARTLLSDPAIMFLDEPTSGLDPVAAREVHDLIIGLRQKGVTIFLTTHRLGEAEKLCDRVAIMNTTLRTIGRPAELRAQLFKSALVVKTLMPLGDPDQVFTAIGAVERWRSDDPGSYVLSVSDPRVAAPEVARALVGAGADVLSIGEARHSLEDVYLELIDEDVEASTMTGIDAGRIRAVMGKELLDYRRNRAVVVTMCIMPLIFLIEPIITILLTPATKSGSALDERLALSLLYLLVTPVIMPATLAASSVVGEREQGTLEPLLTTPVLRQELILGKAAAVMIPTVALSYTLFGLFFAVVRLFAHPVVASAVFHGGPVILALFLLAPLVAGWAIVVGMAVSVRASEVRVAQQLGTLASVPILGAVALLAFGVIHPTFTVAIEFAAGLLAIDALAVRIVSRMFDRERLVTGAKAVRSRKTRGSQEPETAVAQHPAPGGEGDAVATATLALSRRWGGLIDRNRAWQIEVDGEVVGSIASRKTVELSVEPGRHTLHLSSHRHSSPKRSFDAADGQVVSFWCHAARVWPMYLAALVRPDLWISLKQG